MGKYIPPKGFENQGINAVYIDEDPSTNTPSSIVQAEVFEMLLRELHNAIELSNIEPSNDDLTQLYQAFSNIDMSWSSKINYRNKTIVLGSDNSLYILLKPSGPNITLPNNSIVGYKNPVSSSEYWERFFISRDGGIQDLAIAVQQLIARLDILEPQVKNAVLSKLQPLIDMHLNNGIATNKTLGHIKPGLGMVVDEYGALSIDTDNTTLIIDNTNNLLVNETAIKPKIASSNDSGIILVGDEFVIDSNTSSITYGKLSVSNHNSESNKYGVGSYQYYGHLKTTDDYEQNSTANSGVCISPKGLQTIKSNILGIVGTTTITTSRIYTVSETAVYTITAVGGGGMGGSGAAGSTTMSSYQCGEHTCSTCYSKGGGGGGGGGAGETVTTTVSLTKGQQIAVTIGGPGGGTTTFGSLVTARGGGNGVSASSDAGAGIGVSYGTLASSGSSGKTDSRSSGIVPVSCYATGGSGGTGGRSVQGEYGHGGNGGSGGSGSTNGNTNGSNGSNGIQGVCIISLKLGS